FCLVDAATAHARKRIQHQQGQSQADLDRHYDQSQCAGMLGRAEAPVPGEVDRTPETHHRETRENADQNRQQKKQILLVLRHNLPRPRDPATPKRTAVLKDSQSYVSRTSTQVYRIAISDSAKCS